MQHLGMVLRRLWRFATFVAFPDIHGWLRRLEWGHLNPSLTFVKFVSLHLA